MKMRSALSFVLSIGALATAAACAVPVHDDDVSSTQDSLTERDWGRAISYLGSLDYLPWGYTDDGCYARAIYYTMNLAAEGIASNHVYIIAKDGAHGLGSTGRWFYHVAPLVSRDSTGELRVLDPVYSTQPLLLSDWYDRQSRWENTPDAPILKVAPGTTYGDRSGTQVPDPHAASTAAFREPPSFASMPSFSIGVLNSACNVMHRYIDLDTTTSAARKVQKHQGLSRDSQRLVTELAARGKIDGTAIDPQCTQYAAVPAGCPVDSPSTPPGSQTCCLASQYWCWSASGGFCAAPGTRRTVNNVEWTCGARGEWSR